MLILSCLLAVIVMAGLGWYRGAMTLGQAFIALIVASILSMPFGFLARPIVKAMGCPELLVPTLGTLSAGLVLFVVLIIGLSVYFKKRNQDQDPPSWNRPVGAVVGGVWGLFLVLFLFTGLNTIARADRAMREAAAVNQLRDQERLRVEKKVRREMAPDKSLYAPEEFERRTLVAVSRKMKKFKADPEKVKKLVEPGSLDPFLQQLKTFPLESTIDHFSAIDAKAEELLKDLTIVVGDPILFDRFQRHKVVSDLAQDSTIQALGNDKEIAAAIREKRFRDLLDHPKIVEAARSKRIRRKFAKVDMEKILGEVLGKD